MTLVAQAVEHAVDGARRHLLVVEGFGVDEVLLGQAPHLPELGELLAHGLAFGAARGRKQEAVGGDTHADAGHERERRERQHEPQGQLEANKRIKHSHGRTSGEARSFV